MGLGENLYLLSGAFKICVEEQSLEGEQNADQEPGQ
jgi:hypothetical protein